MWASVQAATTLPSSRSQEDIASAAVKSAYESYTAALTQQGRGGTGVAWAADEYRRLLVEANWAILESRAPRLRLLVRKNLAAIEAGRGSIELALRIYCDALADEEDDVTLWRTIGDHALTLRRPGLARHAFEQGLRCNPTHWPCLAKLCCVLSVSGDHAACVVATRRALRIDPHFRLGRELGNAALLRCVDASPWARLTAAAASSSSPPLPHARSDSAGLRALIADLEDARSAEDDVADDEVRCVAPLRLRIRHPTWLCLGKELLALHARHSHSESGVFADPCVSIILEEIPSFASLGFAAAAAAATAAGRKGSPLESGSPAKRRRLAASTSPNASASASGASSKTPPPPASHSAPPPGASGLGAAAAQSAAAHAAANSKKSKGKRRASKRVRDGERREKEIARQQKLDSDLQHVLQSFVGGVPLPSSAAVVADGSPVHPSTSTKLTTTSSSRKKCRGGPCPLQTATVRRFLAMHGRAGGNSGVASLLMLFIEGVAAFAARTGGGDDADAEGGAEPFDEALVAAICAVLLRLEPYGAIWHTADAPHCTLRDGSGSESANAAAVGMQLFCAEAQFEQYTLLNENLNAPRAKAQRASCLAFTMRMLHSIQNALPGLGLEEEEEEEDGSTSPLEKTYALRYWWLLGRVHNALRNKDEAIPPFRHCKHLLEKGGECDEIVLLLPQVADDRNVSLRAVTSRLDTLEAWGVVKQSLQQRLLHEYGSALNLLCSRYVVEREDEEAEKAGEEAAAPIVLARVKEIIDDLVESSANSKQALEQGCIVDVFCDCSRKSGCPARGLAFVTALIPRIAASAKWRSISEPWLPLPKRIAAMTRILELQKSLVVLLTTVSADGGAAQLECARKELNATRDVVLPSLLSALEVAIQADRKAEAAKRADAKEKRRKAISSLKSPRKREKYDAASNDAAAALETAHGTLIETVMRLAARSAGLAQRPFHHESMSEPQCDWACRVFDSRAWASIVSVAEVALRDIGSMSTSFVTCVLRHLADAFHCYFDVAAHHAALPPSDGEGEEESNSHWGNAFRQQSALRTLHRIVGDYSDAVFKRAARVNNNSRTSEETKQRNCEIASDALLVFFALTCVDENANPKKVTQLMANFVTDKRGRRAILFARDEQILRVCISALSPGGIAAVTVEEDERAVPSSAYGSGGTPLASSRRKSKAKSRANARKPTSFVAFVEKNQGWKLVEKKRKSGTIDREIVAPDGRKFRSVKKAVQALEGGQNATSESSAKRLRVSDAESDAEKVKEKEMAVMVEEEGEDGGEDKEESEKESADTESDDEAEETEASLQLAALNNVDHLLFDREILLSACYYLLYDIAFAPLGGVVDRPSSKSGNASGSSSSSSVTEGSAAHMSRFEAARLWESVVRLSWDGSNKVQIRILLNRVSSVFKIPEPPSWITNLAVEAEVPVAMPPPLVGASDTTAMKRLERLLPPPSIVMQLCLQPNAATPDALALPKARSGIEVIERQIHQRLYSSMASLNRAPTVNKNTSFMKSEGEFKKHISVIAADLRLNPRRHDAWMSLATTLTKLADNHYDCSDDGPASFKDDVDAVLSSLFNPNSPSTKPSFMAGERYDRAARRCLQIVMRLHDAELVRVGGNADTSTSTLAAQWKRFTEQVECFEEIGANALGHLQREQKRGAVDVERRKWRCNVATRAFEGALDTLRRRAALHPAAAVSVSEQEWFYHLSIGKLCEKSESSQLEVCVCVWRKRKFKKRV